MADVLGLRMMAIESSRPRGSNNTFNHLVLTFENGEEVRVPVTEATAAEIRDKCATGLLVLCRSPEQVSPLCPGCLHCDPARSP